MIEVKSESEYTQLREKYPQIVNMFGFDDCEGCKSLKPKIERMCSESGLGLQSPVAVAYCDVKKSPFCYQLYKNSKPKNLSDKDYGVPLITGVGHKDHPSNPNFLSIGAGNEEENKIRTFFNAMGNQIKKMNEQSNNQPQKTQQNAPRKTASLYNPSISNKIMGLLNTIGTPGNHSMRASESGSNDLFCMPGVDCDYDTFRQKVLNFSLY